MRGLAAALWAHGQRALREAGMDYAWIGVDAASPTNAASLCERGGFYEPRRNVIYRVVL